MRKTAVILLIISLAILLAACGSASLNDDEQYALDCATQIPGVTEADLAENIDEIYIVKDLKESDNTIKYTVIKYYTDYYGTTALGEAVFKDGSYYIDANDSFDTSDLSESNFNKIVAQRDVRMVDIGEQPVGAEWEIVQIDTEVIKKALLEQ